MKAWLQRVTEASVTVDGVVVGQIGPGLLVLLGIALGDGPDEVGKIAAKLTALRIFEDDAGLMNRSVRDIGGSVLVVSQFTLYADTRKGNRPGFSDAARPEQAEPLYRAFLETLRRDLGAARVACGVFGASMQVRLLNDGPVSLELRVEHG